MTGAFDVGASPACVLIVDDERRNRLLLEVMLTPEGYKLLSADTGEEALRMVAEHSPDLILLDAMLPGLDGYQVAAALKGDAMTRNIPIVMVTAMDDREARMLGLNAGAEDFLTKPVDRAELCVRVRNLLRLKAYGEYYDKYSQMLEGEVLSRTADLIERTRMLEQNAEALRRSEERTRYALSAAHMGVWELDLRTQDVTWSETMAPLYGLTPAQAPTTSAEFFALIHPDDRQTVADASSTAGRTGGDFEIEFRLQWPDGSTHWNASRARVVRDANGTPARMLGIGIDISERKSLEAQFRQAQKMEAVGQLAGGVAHDFNNLLTAILGFSNFVLDTLEPEDERRADLDEVIKAARRAASLTTQLLAFSRKQALHPTVLDLNTVVNDMRPMLTRLIGEHVEMVSVLAPEVSRVRADRGQLEQVLMNLVVNARDAMPSGGRLVVETRNVELDDSWSHEAAIQPGSYVVLSVCDTGVGMSDATRQRLFEPFFTTKERGKGTGLGLATVYGIVKQSGGYVWVYSEPGKGSAFKVYLPQTRDPAPAVDAEAPAVEGSAGTETVLIVEDDNAVRALMRSILSRTGYTVLDAGHPDRAEALFEQHISDIDLLLTNVIMPGLSGPRLFERLAIRRPGLRVLYVSGYAGDTIVHQGQLDPDIDFLQKPFSVASLNRSVREVLDQ